ncbi:MAG: hypothetical protein ACR2PL_22835 [Dehalococcoidia bacterium]
MVAPQERDGVQEADLSEAAMTDEEALAPYVLPSEEGWAYFDRRARWTLGMSGEEFLAKLEAGKFGDPDADRRVMNMVVILPLARKVYSHS